MVTKPSSQKEKEISFMVTSIVYELKCNNPRYLCAYTT